jgi:phosphoglycerate dehydrogenase-like enzyme
MHMTKNVLITGGVDPVARKKLEAENLKVEVLGARDLITTEALINALQDKHAHLLGGDECFTAEVLGAVKHLQVVGFLGTNYQTYIDVAAATKNGIAVTFTPAANKEAVAEMTIALMFAAVRNIPHLVNAARQGDWNTEQMHDIRGKTLGLVGMGAIGQRVAEMAHKGFDMQILYHDIVHQPQVEELLGAKWMPLDQLLSLSDVVSLHTPFLPATNGLIGAHELSVMKKEAVLVNTARAPLVDGKALYNALVSRQIAVAAFDGYYTEPAPASIETDPIGLLRLKEDVFIMTPHIAWRTIESYQNTCKMAVDSVIDLLNGKPNPYLVNPDYKSAH